MRKRLISRARKQESAYTVAGRSFSRSIDIVMWPVQRRFPRRGKFQMKLNKQGQILSRHGLLD